MARLKKVKCSCYSLSCLVEQLQILKEGLWTLCLDCLYEYKKVGEYSRIWKKTGWRPTTTDLGSRKNIVDTSSADTGNHSGPPGPSKAFQCPYCSYSTNKNTNILSHMCVHTGEKPYACPHCPRRFIQKGNLQSHVYTHTGEKPHACPHCPYRAAQRSNLKSHILAHHVKGHS
ncbi:hypothetical protein SK128_023464 [Halocaridina rubra]|uniref:C2H2-type domain-containing protein n=1 Tax=Halocaridina rubra TaxID=373956 RepID=A0AAN9ABM8_HALRR